MVTGLRPERGGFLRPFGCGWFIREFLLGHGPEGSSKIDPVKGACQEDIFYNYKLALHRAYAEDAIAWENEERIKAGQAIYTPEQFAERMDWHLSRIPYKLVKCRYQSFHRYFHWLKQLGWVQFTGEEERSSVQEIMPDYPGAPPRRLYRLTRKGKQAPDWQWSNPQITLYPEIAGIPAHEYFQGKRKARRYVKKSPTKRRAKA